MSDKYKISPKNRPTPAQPTHVLIKIAGGCLILASIAAIAVEIRGWMIEPGNTQEYLSQEIRDRVSSKPSWHYTDPIEHRGKDSDSASKEQLPPSDEESHKSTVERKQPGETVIEAEVGSQNDRNSPSELAQQFRSRNGPVGKPRESDWRLAKHDRDKIIAAVKAHDSGLDSIGKPKDWQWDVAEVYVDGQHSYLLWVFFKSRNRGMIWRWFELDGEAERIYGSGWQAG